MADSDGCALLESPRNAAAGRVIDVMNHHLESVRIVPDNHMRGAWICFETAKGRVFVRQVVEKGILCPPLALTSFADALQHITQLEPLLTKMEASLGLILAPSDIAIPAKADVLLRLSDGDCIADVALPLSLLASLPGDVLAKDYVGSLALNLCLNMQGLSAGELADLDIGDLILWPEADAKQFGYVQAEDFTWPVQAILPEVQQCEGSDFGAESDVQLRWPQLHVPAAFIASHEVTYSIAASEKAALFCQNIEIAQVQLHMIGSVRALLVTEIIKN